LFDSHLFEQQSELFLHPSLSLEQIFKLVEFVLTRPQKPISQIDWVGVQLSPSFSNFWHVFCGLHVLVLPLVSHFPEQHELSLVQISPLHRHILF
jgi:hypothetical protein